MKTKWEFLAYWCRYVNNEKAAKIADKIALSLDNLYILKHTDYWKRYYQTIKSLVCKECYKRTMLEIACNSSSCVACVCENDNCQSCEFGKKHGICSSTSINIYSKFTKAVKENGDVAQEKEPRDITWTGVQFSPSLRWDDENE